MVDFWDVQKDVWESFDKAMEQQGVAADTRQHILETVEDACVNNLGDD